MHEDVSSRLNAPKIAGSNDPQRRAETSLIHTGVHQVNKGELTEFERWVIEEKGTEKPFSGQYCETTAEGIYHCRKCHAPLYLSETKFVSHCGWPSFDDEIKGAVRRIPDPDGRRTEIVCASCNGHLGHVFSGEGYTAKNLRHCVNSVSMVLVPREKSATERAIFASGCFWGTQYHFSRKSGVIKTAVGYCGGNLPDPTYKQVCSGTTGHLEVVEVIFDPGQISYRQLTELFFETHNFSQRDGQGPDIGSQYLSAIFALTAGQRQIAETVIGNLKAKGMEVATTVREPAQFYTAEEYHQEYYSRKGDTPYCHIYRKIF